MNALPAPRFTIITVSFNAENTIIETAKSLAQQTCQDYEWLVVDGGSTDRTLELIAGLNLPNQRVISESDKGIYDAMNKATRLARGDWLYFLNCGDAFVDDAVLFDVSKAIDLNDDAKLVWGDMLYFDQQREWRRRFRHISPRTLPFDDLNHQATFARRDLFQQVGPFNLAYRTSADYDWLIRVLRGGAHYHYLQRDITRFAVGGMHSSNPQALVAERRALRLQYLAPSSLRLGALLARIRRRFRIALGHGG